MTYTGGKDGAGVAQRLINQIPPHEVFVSLCLGDCAVLRRIKPAWRSVGIDLDGSVLQRWAARRERFVDLELYQVDGVEWLRHAGGWYRVHHQLPDPAAAAADAGSCDLVPQPLAGWFVFADPPYLLDSRRSPRRRYAHEPPADWHRELLATLRWAAAAGADVMVTHYPSPLYTAHLPVGWRTWTYLAMTRGGTMATEQVWCSYPEPAELHDARYLGRDKREREKIHRRVRNLQRKLTRLPALERQAVLDAIKLSP